jgi:hypothetical protein
MMYLVISALMILAPHQGHFKIREYSDLIAFESKWYGIHPLLVTSIIEIESKWKSRKHSTTNDFGLMQVHVARRGSARFLGREKELYDPRINIREGTRILAMWRDYHNRWCKDSSHPFWAHYKWGRKVGEISHALKVKRLFETLKSRLQPKLVAGVF